MAEPMPQMASDGQMTTFSDSSEPQQSAPSFPSTGSQGLKKQSTLNWKKFTQTGQQLDYHQPDVEDGEVVI